MVEPLTVDRATMDCFVFAMTDGRSHALTAVLAVVIWCFPEGRLAGAPLVKLFGRELEDTSAAETAVAAVVRCNCCCGCSCCDDMEGPNDEGNSSSLAGFLSSSCPSHASWNWLGASCCPALLLLQRDSIPCR